MASYWLKTQRVVFEENRDEAHRRSEQNIVWIFWSIEQERVETHTSVGTAAASDILCSCGFGICFRMSRGVLGANCSC